MYGRKTAKSLLTALLVGFTFLAVVSVAEAQSKGGAIRPICEELIIRGYPLEYF